MQNDTENREIEIGQETLKILNITRKWTMFVAIVGFIIFGLIVVIGLVAGTFLSTFNSGAHGNGISDLLLLVVIIVLITLYFLPLFSLFRFSKHMAIAISFPDKNEFHKAFKNLKYFFVYLGILIIVLLTMYFVTLVLSGTTIAFLKSL
jgi:hypothetical protein